MLPPKSLSWDSHKRQLDRLIMILLLEHPSLVLKGDHTASTLGNKLKRVRNFWLEGGTSYHYSAGVSGGSPENSTIQLPSR